VAAWLIELAFVHEIKAGLSSGAAFGHPELAHVQPNTERAIRTIAERLAPKMSPPDYYSPSPTPKFVAGNQPHPAS
jgi:hypothetical protein